MTKRNNQQRQNKAQRNARADLWDMLNAFVTTPDIHAMYFANNVGELNITRAVRDTQQQRRIGFDTADAVGSIEADDSDEDEYEDEDEVRPAEEIYDYVRKIFKR